MSKANIILVPQPSDDPNDPLVRQFLRIPIDLQLTFVAMAAMETGSCICVSVLQLYHFCRLSGTYDCSSYCCFGYGIACASEEGGSTVRVSASDRRSTWVRTNALLSTSCSFHIAYANAMTKSIRLSPRTKIRQAPSISLRIRFWRNWHWHLHRWL